MKPVIVGLCPWNASGPGWSNFGLTVIVRDRAGKLSEVCIQGHDLTSRALDLRAAMMELYEMLENEAAKMGAGEVARK